MVAGEGTVESFGNVRKDILTQYPKEGLKFFMFIPRREIALREIRRSVRCGGMLAAAPNVVDFGDH